MIAVGTEVGNLMCNDQMCCVSTAVCTLQPPIPVPRVIMERASGSVSETCLSGDSVSWISIACSSLIEFRAWEFSLQAAWHWALKL
jgi:hypothetical protein